MAIALAVSFLVAWWVVPSLVERLVDVSSARGPPASSREVAGTHPRGAGRLRDAPPWLLARRDRGAG